MPPFDAINKAPGVYIEEIDVPGPIPGVGTSTAAFVGPALRGDLAKPTLLTSFSQFRTIFGDFIASPKFVHVTHAVQGFFDNGGTTCYFVRAGTGKQASLRLNDRASTPHATLVVTAKAEGQAGDSMTVEVEDAHIASGRVADRAEATIVTADVDHVTVTAADAQKFRPGDIVQGATGARPTIASIVGGTITFLQPLDQPFGVGSTIRIGDLNPNQTTIRLDTTDGIEAGTYIGLSQQTSSGTHTEAGVVRSVDRVNNFISLESGLVHQFTMASGDDPVDVQSLEFNLIIHTPGVERFANLSMDERHSRFFANVIRSDSVKVEAPDPSSPTPPPGSLPAVTTAPEPLAGGADDHIDQIGPADFKAGIDLLEKVDEVNILCVPDDTSADVQKHMIEHCEKTQDRFAILDPDQDADPNNDTAITNQRALINSDNGYAALYYPKILIANPLGRGKVKVRPSGHIAGVYANTDNTRGVHKAPANVPLRGVLELEKPLTDTQQGILNEQGINALRTFPGIGLRVWGARTIAPKVRTQWRYVNVRRLLLFLEESIQEGTQFAVFEPNDLGLRKTVVRQVTDFLTRVWRDGALFGATPNEAFKVRADDDLNPPTITALGQLVIEVKVRPVVPAEFIVFQVIQDPTGAALTE